MLLPPPPPQPTNEKRQLLQPTLAGTRLSGGVASILFLNYMMCSTCSLNTVYPSFLIPSYLCIGQRVINLFNDCSLRVMFNVYTLTNICAYISDIILQIGYYFPL